MGWLYLPDEAAAGNGVLICPPLGIEMQETDRLVRWLARALVREGFPVLHFEYDGTGDSSGSWLRGGGLPAWLGSIEAAARELRRCGASRLLVVGLRFGATLLAEALGDGLGEVEAAALWDPFPTGRRFLREQEARLVLSTALASARADGYRETAGHLWSPEAWATCARLDLVRRLRPSPVPALVLTPSTSSRWADHLAQGPGVTVESSPSLSATVDYANDDLENGLGLDRVVEWAREAATGARVPVRVLPRADEAVIGGPGARRVVERLIRIPPNELFAVETAPVSGVDRHPVTVIFATAARLRLTGPCRAWADCARLLATHGIRSMRVDSAGMGDSPVREQWGEGTVFAPTAIDDVRDVAAMARAAGDRVLLVGLCSSGYNVAEASLTLPGSRLVAFNPVFHARPPELRCGGLDPRRELCRPRRSWLQGDGRSPRIEPGAEGGISQHKAKGAATLRKGRLVAWLKRGNVRRPPRLLWWLADASGVQRSPARSVIRLASRSGESLLVCTPRTVATIRTGRPLRLRRALRTGGARLQVEGELNEGLWDEASRLLAQSVVLEEALALAGLAGTSKVADARTDVRRLPGASSNLSADPIRRRLRSQPRVAPLVTDPPRIRTRWLRRGGARYGATGPRFRSLRSAGRCRERTPSSE